MLCHFDEFDASSRDQHATSCPGVHCLSGRLGKTSPRTLPLLLSESAGFPVVADVLAFFWTTSALSARVELSDAWGSRTSTVVDLRLIAMGKIEDLKGILGGKGLVARPRVTRGRVRTNEASLRWRFGMTVAFPRGDVH